MSFKSLQVVVLLGASMLVTAGPALGHTCGDRPAPLLSVADFDGSGRVDGRDIALLRRAIHSGQYQALYDRNGDRLLDLADLRAAVRDLRATSTTFDREVVAAYTRFQQFQSVRGPESLLALGYLPGTEALRGHGVHWLSPDGAASTQGLKRADKNLAEGLNVPSTGESVWAMFWGDPAQPLFEDPAAPSGLSALDYPASGGVWENKPVQAFASEPGKFFSSSEENWHPHAGLCAVIENRGRGPEIVVHQHMTYAACQALPSLGRTGIVHEHAWMNFWMMHMWLFDLNPNGIFGEHHPCMDPQAPPEESINGDRPVPPFFQGHGGH